MATQQEKFSTRAERVPGAHAIGMRVRRSDAMVRRVREGFDFARWERLEKRSGLSREQLAEFTGISPRTLARRQKSGRLTSDESDRLLRAARIFEQACALFDEDEGAARRWLLDAAAGLGGATPLDYASTEVGAREVERLIGRLEHGVFA